MDSSAANVGMEVGSLVLDELFLPLFCYGSAFSSFAGARLKMAEST